MGNKVIIYEDSIEGIVMIQPVEGFDAQILADELVPEGTEKFIVDRETVPNDWTFKDRWKIINGKIIVPEISQEEMKSKWRETQIMSRQDFCLGFYEAGLIPEEEVVDAAMGKWPASMDTILEGMSSKEAMKIKITWASTVEIGRTNPLLSMLVTKTTITDEQLDQIYGYPEA